MPALSTLSLLILGAAYAICALGLLYSRVSSRHGATGRRKRASRIDRVIRAVPKRYGAAVGAEIDAAFDRLAARRDVPRDQLTRAMVDKEFRHDVRKAWSTSLRTASRPKPGYVPGAIEAPKQGK